MPFDNVNDADDDDKEDEDNNISRQLTICQYCLKDSTQSILL